MTTTPAPGSGAYAALIEKDHDPWTYDAVITFRDLDPSALRDLRDDLERMGWIAQAEELADLIAGEDWASSSARVADELDAARRCLADLDQFLNGDSTTYGFSDAYDAAAMAAEAIRGILDAFARSTQ